MTSNDKNNAVWKSKFFKSGIVGGVKMLQRADMLKLPKETYGSEKRFTPGQEQKQVGRGFKTEAWRIQPFYEMACCVIYGSCSIQLRLTLNLF